MNLKLTHPKLYAAGKVFLIVFLSQFLVDVLGFLGDLREWARGTDVVFPALAPIGKAFVAAVSGAAAAVVSVAINTLRPSSAPTYVAPAPPQP